MAVRERELPAAREVARQIVRTDDGVAEVARHVLGEVAGGRLAQLPVTVRFWDGSELPGEPGAPIVVVRRPSALTHLVRAPGQLGLARAWVDGSLDVDGDLESVLRVRAAFANVRLTASDLLRLMSAAFQIVGRGALRAPPIPEVEARVRGRRRSLGRDRQAVRHHYDVSNRFYELVLGPSMVYSCAYFASAADSLEVAQERKLDLICRKLALNEGERLLDVGCGWGSLLIHAAANYGVHGLGVTLSEPQAQLARARVAEAGLAGSIEIRVQDYREVSDGPFDKIASVGMYEHVGRAELGHYAAAVAGLLRPGGLFLNHGITRLRAHAPGPDPFIARYVFPDGELHPVTDVMVAMQTAGLEVRDVESLREHYPPTLRRWSQNLARQREAAIAEVGDQRERVWRLYMLASALGFEDGEISIYQVLAARSGNGHGLPLDRLKLLTGRRSNLTAHGRQIAAS